MANFSDWISLNTADGPMRAYVARPAQPAERAIVLLQEAFGVNEHIQALARRFAEQGFLTIAPDLFHRDDVCELGYDQHADAVALISRIGPAAIEVDVHAVLSHLEDAEGLPMRRCAVVGFCFGGRAAFTAATCFPALGAAVVFYGPGIAAGPHAVLGRAESIKAPMLLHVGSEDPTIPQEQVRLIDESLRAAGVSFEQHVYAGAGHAFVCDARPGMYREQAARLAWQRTLDFLAVSLPTR